MDDPREPYDISMDIVTTLAGMPGEYIFGYLMEKDAPTGPPTLTSQTFEVEIVLGRPNHLPERSQFAVSLKKLRATHTLGWLSRKLCVGSLIYKLSLLGLGA